MNLKDDANLKERIVEIMEENHKNGYDSGYFCQEISEVLGADDDGVGEILKNDKDFFYDEKNERYEGWRLSKYR